MGRTDGVTLAMLQIPCRASGSGPALKIGQKPDCPGRYREGRVGNFSEEPGIVPSGEPQLPPGLLLT